MSAISWKKLISTAGGASEKLGFKVFYRSGNPLLILPAWVTLPREHAFALYAPQTFLGRLARTVWSISPRQMPLPGVRQEMVDVNPDSPFLSFLRSFSDGCSKPAFVSLAGNPNGPAPRFLFLVFDNHKRPTVVVKAGYGAKPAELIRTEHEFLNSVWNSFLRHPMTGIPKVLGTFDSNELQAFAMPYIRGSSPRDQERGPLPPLLLSWLDQRRVTPVASLPAWQRLTAASGSDPLFGKIHSKLSRLGICPALFHGDFVPWNIKRSPMDASWTVLDWERGEIEGPPAFDWFHYAIQTAILANKETGGRLMEVITALLCSTEFQGYITTAGLKGFEREWLLAYLFYCRDVLRPREGSPQIDWLLIHLARNV